MRKRKQAQAAPPPRVLIVTPEITYLPDGMGNMSNYLTAKAGGLADVSASLVSALFDLGSDVHVALPHFRRMFHVEVAQLIDEELKVFKNKLSDVRIHLAEDRSFYYRNEIYSGYSDDNLHIAMAFQREVINNIVPRVKPDLIHCNDWMTGLIPAMARRMNIPCLFTIHNIHTQKLTLAQIEDKGIDAAEFWRYLFFLWPPHSYEEARPANPIDLLASGVFASHFINTVSPTFLEEIAKGYHNFIPANVRYEITQKKAAGCAVGILNAPDPMFNPATDPRIHTKYDFETHLSGKRANKLAFQKRIGLSESASSPLLFWPSRLDPVQKGCQLLSDILYRLIDKYWMANLQVAIVANGSHQRYFHDIVHRHNFYGRVAVCNFDETLSHLGYAASDFLLVPSLFEPCGLPQMIGGIYGSLPIVHDTGGLHDTISHLDILRNTGNGFSFNVFDANGLFWAIDEAMRFYEQPRELKRQITGRIMSESLAAFNHSVTARQYIDIYEKMLQRPLINPF